MARLVADLDASRAARAARGLHAELGKLGAQAKVLDAKFSQAELGTAKYARSVGLLNRALKRGVIDQKEHDRLLGIAKEKYNQAALGAEHWGAALQRNGRQISDLGGQLTRLLTIPIAAVGVGSIKLASDFQSSFAGVRKTVQATDAEFAILAQGMRDLAKEIPVNVNELNKIGESAGQLGIKKDNILAFTRVIADLSVTTNLASEEAATMLARFDNITTGGAQKTFEEIGSTVVALGNNLATTEREIVEMALRLSGTGAQIGLTQADILSLAGALSSLGLEAEAGGTAFSRVMVEMQNAVMDGGESLRLFTEVAGPDFADTFAKDAALAINQFIAGLARMKEEGRNVNPVLDELGLGGIRVSDALRRTGNAVGRVSEAVSLGRQAWADNNALTKEAAERYKTFESQLTLFWNRLKDVGIELGTSLLPVLRDVLDIAEPGVDLFARMAKSFADLSTPVKVATLGVASLAAAIGPLLFVTGQLITAWGTLALAAPKLAGSLGLLVSPIGLVAAALVGLGLAAYEAIDRWRRDSEEGIAAIIASNNRARESVRLLKEELASGLVLGRTFEEAITTSARLGLEIQGVEEDVRSAQRQIDETDWDQFAPDQAYIRQQKLRKSIEEGNEAISLLESELAVVDLALARVGDTTIEWDEAISGGGGSGGGGVRRSAAELTKAITEQEEAVRKAEKAIQEAQAHYKEYSGAIEDVRKALGDLDAIGLAEWVEENLSVPPETTEQWQALAEAIGMVEASLDSLGSHVAPIDVPESEPASVIFDIPGASDVAAITEAIRQAEQDRKVITAEIVRLLKDGTITLDEAFEISQNLTGEFKHWTTELIDGFAAIGAIVGEFDADLGRAISRAADLLALYQQVGKSITTTQALGAVAGNVQSAQNPDYAAAGAVVGAIIGGIIGTMLGGQTWAGVKWGAVIGSWLGGMIKKGLPEFYGSIQAELGEAVIVHSSLGGGFNTIAKAFGKQIKKAIDDILFLVGAELESIAAGVDIKTKKGTSVFIDGQEFSFKEDTEAAIDFAITEALKRATITGASPEVIAALANTIATDLDSLFADLEVAVKIRDINLDETQRAFRAIGQEFDFLRKKAIDLGMGIEALNKITLAEVTAFTDLRNQILGIEEDPKARLERQAAMYNAELALRKADLAARKASLEAEAAVLRMRVDIEKANIGISEEQVRARLALLQIEGRLVEAAFHIVGSAADALEVTLAQLNLIDQALAALEGLEITQADLDKIGKVTSGGKGGAGPSQAEQDAQRVADAIESIARSLLPDLARALAELDAKYEDLTQAAKNDAAALARLIELREQEEQLLIDAAVNSFYGKLRDFENVGGSALSDALGNINQGAAALRKEGRELGKALEWTGERIRKVMDRINDAAQRQRELLLEATGQDLLLSMLDFLGKGEEAERMRWEISKAQLIIAYEELKLAAEKYNIELEYLKRLGELVGEIEDLEFPEAPTAPTPEPRFNDRARDSADSLNDALAEMARRLDNAKVSIGDYLAALDRGEQGGVSTMGGLAAAREQFDEVLRQARGGNIQAIEAFPEVSQNLLDLARKAFASTPEFQDIFQLVRAAGLELLGISRVTQDNVIFDERFFTGQQQQTSAIQMGSDRTTNAVRAGAERTAGAVEDGARRTIEAINRQGDKTSDRLRRVEDALTAALAGQQRQRGAA